MSRRAPLAAWAATIATAIGAATAVAPSTAAAAEPASPTTPARQAPQAGGVGQDGQSGQGGRLGQAARADAVAAGKQVYERCLACHALAYDRTGPRHCGLFGRRAGSVPGFAYSDAMRHSRIVWNEKTLNGFLADPVRSVPGTSMGYAGVKDPVERADLLAYLKQASRGPQCLR